MIFNVTNLRKFRKFHKFLTDNGYEPETNICLDSKCFWLEGGVVEISDNKKWFIWASRTQGNHLSFPKDLDKILENLNLKEEYYKDNKENKQEEKMKSNYKYTITPNSVSLFGGGQTLTARDSHPNFKKIVSFIMSGKYQDAEKLFSITEFVKTATSNKITIKNNGVYYLNIQLHNAVCNKILDFVAQGLDVNPWLKFLEKLLENPSKYIYNNLYSFMEQYKLSIDDHGDIYALKAVKYNLKSKWTDLVQYVVGETYSEPRVLLTDDQNDSYCGKGLWFGHEKFVFDYGSENDHVLVVKVNPKDVIAIPSLSSYQKMAACAITPILDLGEISNAKDNFTFSSNYVNKVNYDGKAIVTKGPKRDKNGRFCKQ